MVFSLVSSVQEKLGEMLDSEASAAAAVEQTEQEAQKKEEEVSVTEDCLSIIMASRIAQF